MRFDNPGTALLIADANPAFRDIRNHLMQNGWQVQLASDLAAVRAALDRSPVSVALVDLAKESEVRILLDASVDSGALVVRYGADTAQWAWARCNRNAESALEAILRANAYYQARARSRGQAHEIEGLKRERIRLESEVARFKMQGRGADPKEVDDLRQQIALANRAKSAFLANMSHELRTPLNAILGYAELLQEDARELEADELVPDLQKIHDSGKGLLNLINDILDLARIEAGRAEVYPQMINVRDLCEDVLSGAAELAAENHNALELDIGADVDTLFSDQRKTRQCLKNLVSNACKFTENGRIMLRARRAGARLDEVSFEVNDTGIGLTPEQSREIFREFVQADDSTTRKRGGTGLGLTITLRLTELLGGTLSVSSQPGVGSTFTLCLPQQTDPEETEDPDWTNESEEIEIDPGDTPLVLVIDDDEAMRFLLARYLNTEGYRVIQARSGAEGVSFAERYRPDIICLDAVMPEMDGWATLKAMKSKPMLAHIPVVMVTMVDDRSRGIVLGASDYLVKPIGRDLLLRTISRVQKESAAHPILLVEDDGPTREMTARMLRSEGYRVMEAENGRVALERIRDVRPALILLDLMMPELDGFSVVTEVRRTPAWSDIPIVVVTAMDLPPSQRGLLELQVEAVVGKAGYDRDSLVEEVRRIVGDVVKPPPRPVG